MRYLKSIFEWVPGESPADSLNLPDETDYSALSPDELMMLIDQAAEENNFARVKLLTSFLKKEEIVTEKSNAYIKEWTAWSILNESLQEGRAIIQQLIDKELKRQAADIQQQVEAAPEEQREETRAQLEREIKDTFLKGDFETIQRWQSSQPKWIGPFTAFRFLQGASMQELEQLKDLMVRMRPSLSELPHEASDYAKMMPSRNGEAVPGYEKLGDDLNELFKLSRGRWVVKALPKNACSTPAHISAGLGPVDLREKYKEASPDKQKRLLELGAELNDLDKPALINAVRIQLSGKPTIDAVIDDLANAIANANTDRGKMFEDAIAAYPSVAVLYNGPNHVVFSFRNDSQLPTLCPRAKGWCIQPLWYNTGYAGRFWSYADGSLQLGVIDYSVDATNNFHTVGWTIRPNGQVQSVCNQPNRCNSGDSYKTMMRGWTADGERHSYPQEVIDAIELVFEEEVAFKTSTDALYKKLYQFSEGERDREQALVKTILGLVRNIDDLVKSTSRSVSSIADQENRNKQIIAAELKNLKNSDAVRDVQLQYIAKAKTNGLISPADVKIFEIIIGESTLMTPQLVSNIKERNSLFASKISEMVKKAAKLQGPQLEKWNNIIQSLYDANTYLDAVLLKKETNNGSKKD